MKKLLAIFCVLAVFASTAVAAPKKSKVKGSKIGVSMPTKDLQRWNQDGANMKAQLEAAYRKQQQEISQLKDTGVKGLCYKSGKKALEEKDRDDWYGCERSNFCPHCGADMRKKV